MTMICQTCETNKTLDFQMLVDKCIEANFHEKYIPIRKYFEQDICFECYESEIEGMSRVLYEVENDL